MELKTLILIPVYNQGKQIKQNLPLLNDLNNDILMIDDGSTDNTYGILQENAWLKYIKHDYNLGIGASIISGSEYARDLEYDILIILNLNNMHFKEEIVQLLDNINYGYDIVNSSRILENFDYHDIPQEFITLTEDLSAQIRDITGFDITDPLSCILAIRTEAFKNMELTEFNHCLFLQLWIQANYFGFSIIEIPAQSGTGFGEELTIYDDPMDIFLSLIETEKFLYPKKNLN